MSFPRRRGIQHVARAINDYHLSLVVPAQAGTHLRTLLRVESGIEEATLWIPAFAEMTAVVGRG